jgi:polysaccharide export outer membrane protein
MGFWKEPDMFQWCKPKLQLTLAIALLSGLGICGCQVSLQPIPSPFSSNSNQGSGSGGSGQVAQNAGPSPAYLPYRVQQASYQGDDAKGQPIFGAPPGAAVPPGPNGPFPPAPLPGGSPSANCGGGPGGPGENGPIPRELNMVSLPPWTVAPPDILYIDAARLVPKGPYRIEPLEVLIIKANPTLPGEPIEGPFTVTPEGTVNLGFGYGSVTVRGLTVDQIQDAIRQQLGKTLKSPQVSVSLFAFRGQQQVRGEHLVNPWGSISLGTYGYVYVAGMTLGQVKCAIERHLSEYVDNPQISVDVYAYNSKWYTIVYDGGGYGQQIFNLPITGNETVLSALGRMQGLAPSSSTRRIWIARPSPCASECDQILPVDWEAVLKGGSTCTNYQLMPGDRIIVDADPLIKLDNWLAKILNPIERVLGVTLLATTTVQSFNSNNNGSNGSLLVTP